MKEHVKDLLKNARKINCDTIVAFEPKNLFYMTGFWGEGVGLLTNDNLLIFAPELEAKRAESEAACQVIPITRDDPSMIKIIAKFVRGCKACTDCQDYNTMSALKRSVRIQNAPEVFQNTRMIKTTNEIRILKRASRIIDEMFDLCTKEIKEGMRESELQSILMSYAMNNQMFDTGYESTLNPLIIASGPNSSQPHAQVTQRKFRRRNLIVVDLTLRYKGYVSDATRTFALGRPTKFARKIYDIVRESQKLGLAAVKPNVLCSNIDSTCRQYIEEQGFGEYFIHSTGHGIGLDVHELPWISKKSTSRLKRGMAITVEPGIYMGDILGVRIEDSLIVQDKPIVMHKFTKELITL